MSFGGGGRSVSTPTQTVNPDRNAALSEEQRVADRLLGDYTIAMMRGAEGNYNYTPMQLYPLNNYMRTAMPVFNPQAYNQQYARNFGGYNLNSIQPFGLQSAGRPYQPTQYMPGPGAMQYPMQYPGQHMSSPPTKPPMQQMNSYYNPGGM